MTIVITDWRERFEVQAESPLAAFVNDHGCEPKDVEDARDCNYDLPVPASAWLVNDVEASVDFGNPLNGGWTLAYKVEEE